MEYNNTYLSDDDEIDIEMEDNINIELDQYGMPIEEIDEEEGLELMRIINSKKILNNDLDLYIYNETKTKIIKDNKNININIKNKLNLNDFNVIIDKKIEDKKPKKFISKRIIEKKNLDPSLSIIKNEINPNRKFNPKLIPYLFSDKYNKQKKINNF